MNEKQKIITKTIGIFISWWIIIYISCYLGSILNFQIFNIDGNDKTYLLCYYMIAIVMTLLIYITIVPNCIKDKNNTEEYFKNMKITYVSKHSKVYIILISLGATIGYLVFGNIYRRSLIDYITYLQPPIVEELLFRGIMLSILSNSFSKRTAIIIDSVLFGLLHIMLSPINAIVATIIGIVYCMIVFRTKSIIPTMMIHYLQNTNLYQLVFGAIFIILYERYEYLNNKKIKQRNKSGDIHA